MAAAGAGEGLPVAPPAGGGVPAGAAVPADPNRACRRITILSGGALLLPIALRVLPDAAWTILSLPITIIAATGNVLYQTLGRVASFTLQNGAVALYKCGSGQDLNTSDVATLSLISTFAVGLIYSAIRCCGKPRE